MKKDIGKMSKSTIKTFKHSVWKSFAKYIKMRDADKLGRCVCCTCGIYKPWNDPEVNAGHFIGGRTNSVLFDETIVHPQCSRCNCFYGGRPWDYEQFMIKRYGYNYETLEEIKCRRNIIKKYTMEELKDLKKHFDGEFERIRKEKGL